MYHLNKLDIFGAFLTEALIFQMMHFYIVSPLEILKIKLGDLFLEPREITPNRIEGYELTDFGEFFSWASKNIRNKKNQAVIRGAKHEYYQLRLGVAQHILTLRMNPSSIKIPVKIFDSNMREQDIPT